MPLQSALDALKRKDFASARDLVAQEKAETYTLQHFLIKGLSEIALQEWAEAQGTFAAATQRFPDHAAFWLNRGIAEENMGLIDAAIESQKRCLLLNVFQGEVCGNLSNLYRKKKLFVESETMARHALEKGAARGDTLNCLGLALARQGKFSSADAAFRQAQQESPNNPTILANRANLAVENLNFDEAWHLFAAARALEDKPVFRHDEALARMLSGDYETGWRLFEARLEMPNALRLIPSCPHWRGENLKGKKLLIFAEQGFGDVIQFCRYQEFLPDGDLVWAVPGNLVRLLSSALRGIVVDEKSALSICDFYTPILSLPLLTTTRTQIPSLPHLSASAHPLLPSGKHSRKIGLVWAGSKTHERDHERSIPLKLFAPFLRSVPADFYAPFTGEALDDIGDLPITSLAHLINDFADTAALLKQMDCVITVDTAVVHLAGTLGIPTYLLLSHCPDWRWGVEGEKTQWYQSLILIRQSKYGDWIEPIRKVALCLNKAFGYGSLC